MEKNERVSRLAFRQPARPPPKRGEPKGCDDRYFMGKTAKRLDLRNGSSLCVRFRPHKRADPKTRRSCSTLCNAGRREYQGLRSQVHPQGSFGFCEWLMERRQLLRLQTCEGLHAPEDLNPQDTRGVTFL